MNTVSHRFNTGDLVFIPLDSSDLSEGMDTRPYQVGEIEIRVHGPTQRVLYGLGVPGYPAKFWNARMDESVVFASVQEGEKVLAAYGIAKQEVEPPSTLAKKYRRVWRDGKYIDELIKS